MSVIKALFAAIAIASIAWIAVDRWAPSKAVSQSVPSLDCQECQSVARGVSDFLATAANAKLEAGTGVGRRMPLMHSEGEILKALDAACLALPAAGHEKSRCERTLASHQHLIEDALFNKDIDTFGRSLCVEILGICDPHQIYDAGEL